MAELEFDPPPGRELVFDGPSSGGAFKHKELAPGQAEQGERRRKLMQLVEAKGEPGYGARVADNFAMGLTRPLSGAMAAGGGAVADLFGKGDGLTAGERYRAGVGAEEDYIKRAEKNTDPYLGFVADTVGGIASGGPGPALARGAATVAQQAPSKLSKVAQWLMGSTGSGAIEGAARNSEDAGSAAIGAGIGGAVSKVGSSMIGALTDRLGGVKAAKKEITDASRGGSSHTLADEGGAVYKKLDDAGISFKDSTSLARDTVDTMAKRGFNPNIHDELTPVIAEIGALNGRPVTWTQLQNIRTQISDARASDDKRVRNMAGHLGKVLDDFIDTSKPTIPARSVGINVAEEAAKARDLWHRGSQAATVEFAEKKGMSTTRDPSRKRETNFGAEVDKIENPKRFSPFEKNPELSGQIRQIAEGDPRLSGGAKEINRWSNNLLGYGTIGSAGGLAALGSGITDPYGIGSGASTAGGLAIGAGLLGKAGAGSMRKMAAERGAARVDDLIRTIVTGSADKAATQNVPREALAKVLAAEQLQRGAGRYSSSWYDKE